MGNHENLHARLALQAHRRAPAVKVCPYFYAIWADGSAIEATPSSLYFATREGKVFRLPARMTTPTAKPELMP